jgi:hypothetical protein
VDKPKAAFEGIAMLPAMTPRTEELAARITAFMDEHIYPAEPRPGRPFGR